MAIREGTQVDTLPVQAYGVTVGGIVTKITCDADGKINIDLTKYVPYIDAIKDVDLGSYDLTATELRAREKIVIATGYKVVYDGA